MLYIDIVDIIYFAIGIAVGVMITTLVDYMRCSECLEDRCYECMDCLSEDIKRIEKRSKTNE